ncbi:The ARF-like 2 binding protein BART/Ubiquitin interaction motif containing protein [Novymonas esmeraldas]|uniref:Cilia- and flagella-associated protein 36 n=1 Tax=Novymonas esmeraldas TaxID=1808958 RepID=A0AAW0F3L5_9TRYP
MTENRWITEALVQFSESPIWVSPIDNFVDDNCCVFSNEPEMKLEYTVVHNRFKELVDSLLTCFVMELGVSMEIAVEALQGSLSVSKHTEDGRSERHAAKKMLKQILNADNFSYFYTMMVKRNLELDILANAALAANGVRVSSAAASQAAEEVGDGSAPAPARAQRAIDANGDMDDEEALRRAIAVSLQDTAAQEQVRAYNEACVQESVDAQVGAVELKANREMAQLEVALQAHAATQDPAVVERYRQEHTDYINKQKESQIIQIQNCALAGRRPSVYDEDELPKAQFSAPEQVPAEPAPHVAAEPSAPTPTPPPLAPTTTTVTSALPPIAQRKAALPAIPSKAPAASTTTSAPTAAATAPPASTPPPAPTKEELEKRAEYMREQREKILARNRATRQEQLDTFVQNTGSAAAAAAGASTAGGAEQAMTVEIARRLRGDLLGEARRSAS